MKNPPDEMLCRFATTLSNVLHERRVTHSQLAKMLGLKSASSVSNWCSGKNYPTVSQLISLSVLLEVSIDELLGTCVEYVTDPDSEICRSTSLWPESITAIQDLAESNPKVVHFLNLLLSSRIMNNNSNTLEILLNEASRN